MSVTKRRRQSANRREWVADIRRRHDYRQSRIPFDATSVIACPCGARAWLTGEATDDDHRWFADFDAAHADCEAEL